MKTKQKLICFDLDGTLIEGSSWESFNTLLSISAEEDIRLFNLYTSGSLAYKDWIAQLIALYKKNPPVRKSDIEALAQSVELRVGALSVVEEVKNKGYEIVLISGAIDTIVSSLALRLGIKNWFATNTAVYTDEGILDDIESMGDEREAKLELLKRFCLQEGYELSEVISIGDGGNDVEIFTHTKGILLGNNKDFESLAWKKIEDLSEIGVLI